MRLTGKSLKDFKKWLDNEFDVDEQPIRFYQDHADVETYASEHFEILPFSMQYGVLVDWFDSVGIYIEVLIIDIEDEVQFFYDVNNFCCSENFETRPPARQKAIEKANEIYNERD